MTRFIAVDGEADNKGNYILLCDSLGRTLYHPEGIPSVDAFNFLIELPRKAEIVCFGLNYDANQWLKDLPRSNLERLVTENATSWRGQYKLQWIPSKMFTITVPGKRVTVSEVFGFFQTSFVKALQQWGFDPPAEIETMKQRRGTFTREELQRVTAYCQAECKLLVRLMEALEKACDEANCKPRGRWIGAGAIASALLSQHGVKTHHQYDADLFGRALTDEFVLRSYFGGRVELYRQGWENDVSAFDIRSAYPYAALHIPSLANATVKHVKRYRPSRFAMWCVKWDIKFPTQIAPFPVRVKGGRIVYPLAGEGVYHGPEVEAAMLAGYRPQVLEGVIIEPHAAGEPLQWIRDVYKVRERYKREGNQAEKALKLGLNSVYGKFAQGYGFGNKPTFQSYYWAGYITSFTRARMLERLVNARRPVMSATDGVVAGSGNGIRGDGIGTWERATYARVATIQPGVYVAEPDTGRIVKSRGFFARDVDYDQLIEDFERDPDGCYHYVSRRFIGLKVALHRKDFSVWRQWIDERRSVAFEISFKRRVFDGGATLLYPCSGPFDSLPYEPKQSLYDDPTDEVLENMVRDDQPHREVD